MIRSVTAINYVGDSLKMVLASPEESGFAITNITGLGASKADINIVELPLYDGSIYNSARLETRNIVLYIKFLPNPTIEDSRLQTYKFFPVKRAVTLVFETDKRTCEIIGYVESNEPEIFDKQEGCQISILCPDPYFYSSISGGYDVTTFDGIYHEFEFPFSNESLTETLVEFGTIQASYGGTICYSGDAETGITITMTASGNVKNPILYNTTTNESMAIDTAKMYGYTGASFGDGDTIIINTNKRQKSVLLLRDGEYTNILNCLDKRADWFHLVKGDNVFAYAAEVGASVLSLQIKNRIVYEGI